ncbi:MAG: ABC transporter substrate-binding protein [Candidatus Limnocylindria bacterium]
MPRLGSVLLAVVVTASACTSTAPPQGNASPATGGERGGRVVGGVGENLTSLSPLFGFDFISGAIWSKFYRPLIIEDPDTGELKGELAKDYALSSDRLTVTFTLRDGLVWSDGTAFTGEDYRYTAEAAVRSKKSRFRDIFKDVVGFKDYLDGKADSISGITVADGGKTIAIKRTLASCIGIRDLGMTGFAVLPKHHFVKDWDNKSTDATKNIDSSKLNEAPPASIGPFIFKEHRPGVEVSMTRNDRYWKGAPLLDEFIMKLYAGPQALKAAILTGELTYASYVPANDVEEIQKTGQGLSYHKISTPTDNNFIGWNIQSPKAPWLANKQVRQALWHGLDVKAALQKVMGGFATQTFTHTAPSFWSYPEGGAGLNKYPYDTAKAKQLLEQAGAKMGSDGVYVWTNGQPMQMRIDGVGGGAPPGLVIEIAQEQYKQIGIKIEPNLLAFPAFVERNTTKVADRDGSFWGSAPGGSEGEPVWPFYHSKGPANFWNVNIPALDKAIDAGRDGPDCSQAARKSAYAEANRILNDEAVNTWLWMRDFIAFSSNKLTGFQPKPFSLHSDWNIEKWSIKK